MNFKNPLWHLTITLLQQICQFPQHKLILISKKSNRLSISKSPSSSPNSMNIFNNSCWHIKIYYQFKIRKIHSSGQYLSSYQNPNFSFLKFTDFQVSLIMTYIRRQIIDIFDFFLQKIINFFYSFFRLQKNYTRNLKFSINHHIFQL